MTSESHVLDLLDSAAAADPDRLFLRGTRAMTFAQVAAATHGIAKWLRIHGAEPGARLLIAASNHADAIVATLGAARCGVTFTLLHESIRPERFRRIVEEVEPACIVLDSSTAALQTVVRRIPLLSSGDASIDSATPIDSIGTSDDVQTIRTDPFALIYTSGSTGAPRGVMISHANVLFTTDAIQKRLQYQRDDAIALFLPLSFDYGLYQLFLALSARASVYVGALQLVPLRLVSDLENEQITVLPSVPSLTTVLLRMLQRTPKWLPKLRAVTNTGERLPPELTAELRVRLPQVRIFLMYGLTECKRVSILLPDELDAHPGSVGRPLDGTTADVLTGDGAPARTGEAGDLVVRGPHVAMGYWRAPEETALRFGADGLTLFTGDTCRMDGDGFLYYEGRGDLQLKRFGFRISLLDVEAEALSCPGVIGAAATCPTESGDLHLFVASNVGELSPHTVLRHLRSRIEPYKVPDVIHVVDSLPMTAHGKIDRQSLTVSAARWQ